MPPIQGEGWLGCSVDPNSWRMLLPCRLSGWGLHGVSRWGRACLYTPRGLVGLGQNVLSRGTAAAGRLQGQQFPRHAEEECDSRVWVPAPPGSRAAALPVPAYPGHQADLAGSFQATRRMLALLEG